VPNVKTDFEKGAVLITYSLDFYRFFEKRKNANVKERPFFPNRLVYVLLQEGFGNFSVR
jgi:hypothetical protein